MDELEGRIQSQRLYAKTILSFGVLAITAFLTIQGGDPTVLGSIALPCVTALHSFEAREFWHAYLKVKETNNYDSETEEVRRRNR